MQSKNSLMQFSIIVAFSLHFSFIWLFKLESDVRKQHHWVCESFSVQFIVNSDVCVINAIEPVVEVLHLASFVHVDLESVFAWAALLIMDVLNYLWYRVTSINKPYHVKADNILKVLVNVVDFYSHRLLLKCSKYTLSLLISEGYSKSFIKSFIYIKKFNSDCY